jgi:hypothetical protein
VTVNLRLSLTIFKIGFAAEAASGFATLLSGSGQLPYHGALVLLGPVFTALGILFLYVGRHEWNELHRARVRFANAAFAVSLLAIAFAILPVAYLAATGTSAPASWWALEFGVAIGVVFAVTFVTYALVAAHLVGRLGEIAIGAGLGWAALISGLIGASLSPTLRPIVQAVLSRSAALDPVTRPLAPLEALLAFSYLAFFVAFADAHWRVAKGIVMAS